MKKLFVIVIFALLLSLTIYGQNITKYPDIPRIDVHSHSDNNYLTIRSYLEFRDRMLSETKTDLAMWINVGGRMEGEKAIDTISTVSQGRIMTCISDYTPHKGLTHKAKDIPGYLKRGYVGYKIWYGTLLQQFTKGNLKEGDKDIRYLYIDDPHHEPVISAMEKHGMVMASVHIADPNGPFGKRRPTEECFCPDPVEFWRSITGLERVLRRHPELVVVAAHGAWLMVQDAQLDFLRYLFDTYPHFYVDLAVTDSYYVDIDRENLRDLFIEYSDRVLFGTDIAKMDSAGIQSAIKRYSRSFRILETEDFIEGFSLKQGLNLPREVLENIYYKNALRLYPGLSERMRSLGYKI
jgi:hypothetical protein